MPEKHIEDVEFEETGDKELSSDTGFVSLKRLKAKNIYTDGSISSEYSCDVVHRKNPDAVAILPYIAPQEGGMQVVLRKSFRPVPYYKEKVLNGGVDSDELKTFIEVAAGVIDPEDMSSGRADGEAARRAAKRELKEELGYDISIDSVELLGAATYSSPGLYTEKVYICIADVGGLERGEIETDGSVMEEGGAALEMSLQDALNACSSGIIKNAVTEIAVQRLFVKLLKEGRIRTGAEPSEQLKKENDRLRADNNLYKTRTAEMNRVINRLTRENKYFNKMVREFKANISHELKHPVAAMSGYLKLLMSKKDAPEDKREQWLKVINDEMKKIADVNRNLVELVFGTEDEELENSRFSTAEEIESILREYAFLQEGGDIDIDVYIAKECENLIGVRERFRVVAEGLISNAYKFTKEGEINISVSLSSQTEEKELDFSHDLFNYHLNRGMKLAEVELSVVDSGIGIPKKMQKKIFEPFFQVDSGFDRRQGGMGLGLSVVKTVVEQMQGKIKVESADGSGTSVRVYMPLGISD